MSKTEIINEKKNFGKYYVKHFDHEQRITSLNELEVGDHIVFVTQFNDFCHAIVETINRTQNNLTLIYYCDGKNDINIEDSKLLKKYINSKKPQPTQKYEESKDRTEPTVNYDGNGKIIEIDNRIKNNGQVIKADVTINKMDSGRASKPYIIYKIDYSHENNGEKQKDMNKRICLSVKDTLNIANKWFNNNEFREYNFITNNDEHFAIYCKTGKAGKLFALDKSKIESESESKGLDITITEIAKNMQYTIVDEEYVLFFNTCNERPTCFSRAKVQAPEDLSVFQETMMHFNYYRQYRMYKQNLIGKEDFRKFQMRHMRYFLGFDICGGIAGAVLGSVVLPFPGIGLAVGIYVGHRIGHKVGQWVKLKRDIEKEFIARKLANAKSISHSVMKFKPNVTKPDDHPSKQFTYKKNAKIKSKHIERATNEPPYCENEYDILELVSKRQNKE